MRPGKRRYSERGGALNPCPIGHEEEKGFEVLQGLQVGQKVFS